jgi:dipeptidyl aminopeptidase/acylaminoacyl peptidase
MYTQGHLVYVRDGALVAQPFDPVRLALTGEAVPVGEDIQRVLNSGTVGVFSVSETGLLAYRTGAPADYQLRWLDRGGRVLFADGGRPATRGAYRAVAISPDGTRAATEYHETADGNPFDIWLVDAGGARTRFTSDPASDTMPVWSPDGKRIVFSSNRGGDIFNLYVKDAAGGSAEQLLLQSPESKLVQDWSPDGRFLLYNVSGSSGGAQASIHLWVLPMFGDDRKPRPYLQTEFAVSQARFSPDGRWVAYSSNESGPREVYVRPFPDAAGGKIMVSRNGGVSPHWRRDGRELFYVSADSKMMAVEVTTGPQFHSGTPAPLFTAPIRARVGVSAPRFDVTPDGQRFLFAAESAAGDAASAPSPFTLVQNWVSGLRK